MVLLGGLADVALDHWREVRQLVTQEGGGDLRSQGARLPGASERGDDAAGG